MPPETRRSDDRAAVRVLGPVARSVGGVAGRARLFPVLRWLTAGESHGPALVAILDGVPAGVEVTTHEIGRELGRRRLGYGRGARMSFEQDAVEIVGGVRHGLTLGSPVAIRVGNSEWSKWETVMAADPVAPEILAQQARSAPLTRPRPDDTERIDADPLRCLDPEASARMVAEVDAAKKDADTLGGIVEVLAYGVPPGLGSHTQWDRKLDARLATALMSIQAVKGVEIGDAWTQARSRGSVAHDEIIPTASGVRRLTDRAGGLEGGMTTGEPLRVRAAMKPISSLNRALSTVDVSTGGPATAINQRSDVCAVPAAAIVAESMVALVLAEAATEKFGGDSVAELRRNLAAYLDTLVIR
jgi:chorismate synthase